MFHKYLLELQVMNPHVLPMTMDIVNNYSVRRLLQRGSTTQARNKKVPKDIVNLNNQWRSEDTAGCQEQHGLAMIDVYTDVLAALDTLLQYSEAL
ncbi:hypothetical protein ACA910_003192 [Epithemia clementina (nom. ined.)]